MAAPTENNFIKAADVLPVLDDVMGLVDDVLKVNDTYVTKLAQLEKQLAAKDKVILEKVASTGPVFKPESITGTLNRLQEMNIIDASHATKIASDIDRDPHEVLGLLTKISEALILSHNGEGSGIEKEAGANDDPDPDGWGAFAAGHRVLLKK